MNDLTVLALFFVMYSPLRYCFHSTTHAHTHVHARMHTYVHTYTCNAGYSVCNSGWWSHVATEERRS